MEKLKVIHDKLEEIINKLDYRDNGKNTDWEENYWELHALQDKTNRIRFKNSKNTLFYCYIKTKLLIDIKDEMKRVSKQMNN